MMLPPVISKNYRDSKISQTMCNKPGRRLQTLLNTLCKRKDLCPLASTNNFTIKFQGIIAKNEDSHQTAQLCSMIFVLFVRMENWRQFSPDTAYMY